METKTLFIRTREVETILRCKKTKANEILEKVRDEYPDRYKNIKNVRVSDFCEYLQLEEEDVQKVIKELSVDKKF